MSFCFSCNFLYHRLPFCGSGTHIVALNSPVTQRDMTADGVIHFKSCLFLVFWKTQVLPSLELHRKNSPGVFFFTAAAWPAPRVVEGECCECEQWTFSINGRVAWYTSVVIDCWLEISRCRGVRCDEGVFNRVGCLFFFLFFE